MIARTPHQGRFILTRRPHPVGGGVFLFCAEVGEVGLETGLGIRCLFFWCLFRIAAFLLMFLVSPSRASHFAGKVTKTFRPIIR
ncbi:hypothetical protein ACSVIJ_18740, partial [Pseudomonas sp. NCHU5208]|uniref:hypothetical protein n=1 Tax=Pseudomonas sp. NCHU5208 TaxID=3451354 RepID=UPI003F97DE1C